METSCNKHPHESAQAECRRCGLSWCADCIVHVYGGDKPPLCIQCALIVSGVKTHGLPAMTRKQLRARRKAEKQAARAARTGRGAEAADAADDSTEPPVTATEPAARSVADWSTPWWEENPSPAPVD